MRSTLAKFLLIVVLLFGPIYVLAAVQKPIVQDQSSQDHLIDTTTQDVPSYRKKSVHETIYKPKDNNLNTPNGKDRKQSTYEKLYKNQQDQIPNVASQTTLEHQKPSQQKSNNTNSSSPLPTNSELKEASHEPDQEMSSRSFRLWVEENVENLTILIATVIMAFLLIVSRRNKAKKQALESTVIEEEVKSSIPEEEEKEEEEVKKQEEREEEITEAIIKAAESSEEDSSKPEEHDEDSDATELIKNEEVEAQESGKESDEEEEEKSPRVMRRKGKALRSDSSNSIVVLSENMNSPRMIRVTQYTSQVTVADVVQQSSPKDALGNILSTIDFTELGNKEKIKLGKLFIQQQKLENNQKETNQKQERHETELKSKLEAEDWQYCKSLMYFSALIILSVWAFTLAVIVEKCISGLGSHWWKIAQNVLDAVGVSFSSNNNAWKWVNPVRSLTNLVTTTLAAGITTISIVVLVLLTFYDWKRGISIIILVTFHQFKGSLIRILLWMSFIVGFECLTFSNLTYRYPKPSSERNNYRRFGTTLCVIASFFLGIMLARGDPNNPNREQWAHAIDDLVTNQLKKIELFRFYF